MKWNKDLQTINDSLVNILESYMDFVSAVKLNTTLFNLPEQFKRQMNTMCVRRLQTWMPILEAAIQNQQEGLKWLKKKKSNNQ